MGHSYRVTVLEPETHLASVTYTFTPPEQDHVDICMPAWCPGSYLIRDYARYVRKLSAVGPTGAPLTVRKTDKSTWRVVGVAGLAEVVVTYEIYGHELTVRTNHIEATHAFLHGPNTFVYCEHLRNEPVGLELQTPAAWALATGLAFEGASATPGRWQMTAASIDELLDMPLHAGLSQRLRVPCTVPVELVIWGRRWPGLYDEARLVSDLGKIVEDHLKRMGEAPFEHYTFVLMLTADGYGGLEHRNSSINLYAPNFATTRKAYEGLLELLSHEFFHAWNGKRIAPAPLLAFDYQREAYTPCLWVMEGITSHYDRFSLQTSGVIATPSFFDKVLDDWAKLMLTPGRAQQSLEASSFDAWIKLYKPDPSNLNTTVSYYLKGGLAMLALDLEIRRRTLEAKSLDDVLRHLWLEYGRVGRPHPDDLEGVFASVTGVELNSTFASVIRGTEDPRLAEELAEVGITLRASHDVAARPEGGQPCWLGLTLAGTRVTGVFDGGPGQTGQLAVGDELVAVERFRVQQESEVRALVAQYGTQATLELAWFRRGELMQGHVALAPAPATKYELVTVADVDGRASRYERWLGQGFVPNTTLATVAVTTRFV